MKIDLIRKNESCNITKEFFLFDDLVSQEAVCYKIIWTNINIMLGTLK